MDGATRVRYAAFPKGLKQLMLQSAPADMDDWIDAQNPLRMMLPQDVQDILKKHEIAGTLEDREYMDTVTF